MQPCAREQGFGGRYGQSHERKQRMHQCAEQGAQHPSSAHLPKLSRSIRSKKSSSCS